MTWLAGYAATLDDVALERWCGPALLARGRADGIAHAAIEVAGDEARVTIGDNVVAIGRGGLPASSCTCPARTCKHRVIAALALRARFAASTAAPSPAALVLPADEDAARAVFGARLWKRARAALDRGVVVELRRDGGLAATFVGTGVSCAFAAALPLESSVCSCRKPFPCEHRAIAVAAHLAPAGAPPAIDAAALAPIAAFCEDLVRIGLDHAHAGWVNGAVRLAVVAHVAGLPRLERELEDLAARLELARVRAKAFELRPALIAIARIAARVRLLASRPATHDLRGAFLRTYLDAGAVELACAGALLFTTRDNAAGVQLWFFDGARFAATSVIFERDRRDGNPFRSPRIRLDRPLWGAARWSELVGARLRLDNARRASDGSIAASAATRATVLGRFDAWTFDLGPRIADWRDLVPHLATREPFPLGDPPPPSAAILAPARVVGVRREPMHDGVVAELVDAGGRIAHLELAARRGNEAARRHALALLADPRPLHVLGTLHRRGAAVAVAPIAMYRAGEPIAVLGATTGVGSIDPPEPAAPSGERVAEPFAAVWRRLEDLGAAGLASSPDAPSPAALLDAIVATAIDDELEAQAAIA